MRQRASFAACLGSELEPKEDRIEAREEWWVLGLTELGRGSRPVLAMGRRLSRSGSYCLANQPQGVVLAVYHFLRFGPSSRPLYSRHACSSITFRCKSKALTTSASRLIVIISVAQQGKHSAPL